jgi:hypothetical protein
MRPSPPAMPLGRHHQGLRLLGSHVVAHGPTDDLAGGESEDGRQVEPALASGR